MLAGTAKNVILAGVNSVVLLDDGKAEIADLGAQVHRRFAFPFSPDTGSFMLVLVLFGPEGRWSAARNHQRTAPGRAQPVSVVLLCHASAAPQRFWPLSRYVKVVVEHGALDEKLLLKHKINVRRTARAALPTRR